MMPFHKLYEVVVELSGYQRKLGGTKHQILVLLNANKMKKNAFMLPT